jgi:hypothetical protein
MQVFVLGVAALALVLMLGGGFTRVRAVMLARAVRLAVGIGALGLAALFGLRGALAFALPLASFGAWLVWSNGGRPWPGSASVSNGRASRVTTDHLDVMLDLDTGEVAGRVRKGVFAGRQLETMAPAEIGLLWQDCRFNDPKSAQLLEAWLDRVHPTWREDMARAEREPGAGGVMTRAEALEVLGLKEGASAEDIRRAHKDLMMRFHPDRGGSTYLASKINEAKDLLLK